MPRIFGRLAIDSDSREVFLDGEPIPLTKLEFELMFFLAENINVVVTRDEISHALWGYSDGGSGRSIESHFNRIRRKLNGYDPIITKRGVGYLFAPDGVRPRISHGQLNDERIVAHLVMRPDRSIFWVSEDITKLLGWRSEDVVGTSLFSLFHPEDLRRVLVHRSVVDVGEDTTLIARVATADGSYRRIKAEITPMMNGDALVCAVATWTALDGIGEGGS